MYVGDGDCPAWGTLLVAMLPAAEAGCECMPMAEGLSQIIGCPNLRALCHVCLCASPPTDSPNYKDLVAVVYLSHRAELTVRLDICRKVSRASRVGVPFRALSGHPGSASIVACSIMPQQWGLQESSLCLEPMLGSSPGPLVPMRPSPASLLEP